MASVDPVLTWIAIAALGLCISVEIWIAHLPDCERCLDRLARFFDLLSRFEEWWRR